MASPPFSLDTGVPAASDIISSFPNDEQTFKDVVASWFALISNASDGTLKLGENLDGLTAKTSIVDADTMLLSDSADSNVGKKITFANFKTSLNLTYLPLSGGTLTGNLTIDKATPTLIFDNAAAGQARQIQGMTNGSLRWVLAPGSADAESGSDAGSNFTIYRYDDSGSYLGIALNITRSTGLATVAGDPTAALGIATKQYVDNNAPASVGVGQTWQDVSGSRSGGVSYQNTNGEPIMVSITAGSTVTGGRVIYVSADGSTWIGIANLQGSANAHINASFIVPDTWYYKVDGAVNVSHWLELK